MAQDESSFGPAQPSQRRIVVRAVVVLALVVMAGTCAFYYIEPDWSLQKALYFTLITITTVGYDDQGIDAAGQWVSITLMLLGIATVTWALGQIVQAAVSYQIDWRRRMEGRIKHMDKHIIVCGMGRVGSALCQHLTETKVPFVVIERDEHRAARAVDQGYAVIDGCGTDDTALLKAGLHRARGVVACTSSDPENIMITLSAREINEHVVIVGRANHEDAIHKLKRAGASRVMAPAYNAGKDIATYLSNPALADFLNQTTNAGIGFRMCECVVGSESALVGRTLGAVGAEHPSMVFVAVKHADGNTRIRPDADEPIHAHDLIAVVGHDAELAAFFALAHGDEAYTHRAAG